MSVIMQGNGTTTSSVALLRTYTFRDTVPADEIYRDNQNLNVVTGDGGYDYAYEAGQVRTNLGLSWTMLPEKVTVANVDGLQEMHDLWNTTRGGLHWFTLQPSHFAGNALVTLTTTITGTIDQLWPSPAIAAADGTKLIGAWAILLSGASIGKRFRIRRYAPGIPTLFLDTAGAFASGDSFIIGYPVRITSPMAPRRIGNRNDFFAVDLDFQTVLS